MIADDKESFQSLKDEISPSKIIKQLKHSNEELTFQIEERKRREKKLLRSLQEKNDHIAKLSDELEKLKSQQYSSNILAYNEQTKTTRMLPGNGISGKAKQRISQDLIELQEGVIHSRTQVKRIQDSILRDEVSSRNVFSVDNPLVAVSLQKLSTELSKERHRNEVLQSTNKELKELAVIAVRECSKLRERVIHFAQKALAVEKSAPVVSIERSINLTSERITPRKRREEEFKKLETRSIKKKRKTFNEQNQDFISSSMRSEFAGITPRQEQLERNDSKEIDYEDVPKADSPPSVQTPARPERYISPSMSHSQKILSSNIYSPESSSHSPLQLSPKASDTERDIFSAEESKAESFPFASTLQTTHSQPLFHVNDSNELQTIQETFPVFEQKDEQENEQETSQEKGQFTESETTQKPLASLRQTPRYQERNESFKSERKPISAKKPSSARTEKVKQ